MVKLSILISYFETFDLMMKLLNELYIQRQDSVEFILVDDGCNEKMFDSFRRANCFESLKIIHLPENQGMSNALNVALDNAKGEYIGFIDSDDMITMDYIDVLLETLKNHDKDIIYFNWADFNENNIIRYPENYALWKAIYKRSIFPRFEKDRRINNDVPVQDELRSKEHSSYYIDRVLYIYNSHRVGSITWNDEQRKKTEGTE